MIQDITIYSIITEKIKGVGVKKRLVFSFIVFAFLVGCSSDQGVEDLSNEDSSIVVAKVGEDFIHESEIDMMISDMPKRYRSRYSDAEMKKRLIDQFVEIKVLAAEARKRGVDKNREVRLKIEFLQDQVLAREIRDDLMDNVQVTDADIEQYYNDNPDKYSSPERIKARHILVENQNDAKAVLEKIKKGADFADLARKSSTCPSAKKGGDLGWFGKGKMDPAFEKAAFDLEKGGISDVVKSSFGYHVIKVDDRRKAKKRSLEEVSRSIDRTLKKEHGENMLSEVTERVKKEIGVEINQEYMESLEKVETNLSEGDVTKEPEKKEK